MLCSAVLRSAMLSYIVLPCRTTVRCADLRCASQCHAELRSQTTQCFVELCYATMSYATLSYECATLCYAVLRSATLSYAVLLRGSTQCYAEQRCTTQSYLDAVICCATQAPLSYAVLLL